MKVFTPIVVFSFGLLVGCWHEDLSGFKFHQTWKLNLDSIYSRPSRLATYFNVQTSPSGESFVTLRGIKNDQMQFIISKISADGKVVKDFSKPLENDLIFPYGESSLSGGKLTVLYSTSSGYEKYILQLDEDLNVLKQTHFIPQPYFYPRFTPLGDYVYGATYNNTYRLEKMDLTGNLVWSVPVESKQYPIVTISNRGTILTTQSDIDTLGMVTSISINGYNEDGKVVGKHIFNHLNGLKSQGCGSSGIQMAVAGLSGSMYLLGPNSPGNSYFSVSPGGEMIYAKTSPDHSIFYAEMDQGDLVYFNPFSLQLVQLNRVGDPVWMTTLENLSLDNRGISLSTDRGGNAYVLVSGLILQMKR